MADRDQLNNPSTDKSEHDSRADASNPLDVNLTDVTRRTFINTAGKAAVVAGGAAAGSAPMIGWGQEENSGQIDCGPPPKAKSHSRTGGESFAPLPLPVTPLRRSEKKRPPSPPALVGKCALGTPTWKTVDGKRVMQRDWKTDPADVNTLLRWTNQKLGINYRSVDCDLTKFSYDPRELPVLLLAGHNKFALTDPIRANLHRYVADGGTIIADACCGWNDFNEAFRAEMEKTFPGRPLRKMLPDEPVFSSYYKLADFTYQKADGSQYDDGPCLESIDFGCRSGVIYSPRDLTCGWDGHDHPHGTRHTIDLARQIGANYITYILGVYQLGRFLSTTKVYYEEGEPSRDDFVFAQLVHEGDWDPDPSAVHNLLKHATDNSTMEVKFKRQNVHLKDPKTTTYPLLYMTGHHEFHWDDEEIGRLQRYLQAGGMLLADACCGRTTFDTAFRREISRVFPNHRLERLPLDHPLYRCHYDIQRVEYTPRVHEDFGPSETPELEAILIDGKPAVVYSKFDLGNGWEQFPHAYSYGLKEDSALQIGTNVLVYSVTH